MRIYLYKAVMRVLMSVGLSCVSQERGFKFVPEPKHADKKDENRIYLFTFRKYMKK